MSRPLKNCLLLAAVILLISTPLLIIKPSPPGLIFTGTDSQAQGVIQGLAPDYQPWFASVLKPASAEIESLLFALQAALGAGVIGYYAGYVRGKKKGEMPASSKVDPRAH